MSHRSLPPLTAIALCAGFSCAWAGAGTGSNLWPEEIIDSMDGKRLVVFLPNEHIVASPQWPPADGTPPPLTIAEAMVHLKKRMTGDARYRETVIHEIKLTPIQHHEKEHRFPRGTVTGKRFCRGNFNDHVLVIEVEDDGPGIAPDILPRVFDPFSTTKDRGHGDGLGLHVAQEFIDFHGGRIGIRSRSGKGACVQSCLPIDEEKVPL